MTLTVTNLHAGYGPVAVLRGIDLAVAPGEVLCLMGRNGAGKSTALKAIMGLVRATTGEIRLDATRLDTLPVTRRALAVRPCPPSSSHCAPAASGPAPPWPR